MALFSQAELDRIADLNKFSSTQPGGKTNTPAISAAAKPQTSSSGQSQTPSWMGNMYSNVSGTDWYSTNPTNPNAAKYRADGSPVATIGLDNRATGGTKFDGYGTPEQFNQIVGASSNPQAVNSLVSGWINDGKLISNDSIYNNINKVVNSSNSKGPSITAAASYTPEKNYGTLTPNNQIGVGALGYDPKNPIVSSIMNGVNQQTSAINQGLNLSQQANNAQVSENNRYKDENTAKLAKQKSQDLDNAVQFQNRRGGFYSGGLDYQQGAINNGYQEAVGGLERDTAARNNAIWSNNAALAKNAADNIAMLLQQAPEKIQAAISAAAEKQQAKDIQMAGLTGYYQDTAMFNAVQKKMAENSAAYASASPAEQQRLHAENVQLAASIGGKDTTGNGDYTFGQGIRTVEGQKFDYEAQKDDRDYNYKVVRDAIADGKWSQEFDLDMQKWADDRGLKWATFDLNTKKTLAQMAIDRQQVAISQQNANTSAASAANSNSVARDRLAFDKEQAAAKAAKETKVDYKNDPNFAADVAHLRSDSGAASQLDANAEAFINAYGYDGYIALRKAAGIDD